MEMFYDVRELLGNRGFISSPQNFVRDDQQYLWETVTLMTATELEGLDLYRAVETTAPYDPNTQYLDPWNFTATLVGTTYEIAWNIIDRTVEDVFTQAQLNKYQELVTYFEENKETPIDVGGFPWNTSLDNITIILTKYQMMNFTGDTETTLFDADDTPHVVTIPQLKTLATTLFNTTEQRETWFRNRRKEIKQCTDTACLDAINIEVL